MTFPQPLRHYEDPAEHRAFLIYYARVLLRESGARRSSPVNNPFHWTLFDAAQRARREAAAIDVRPAQRELF